MGVVSGHVDMKRTPQGTLWQLQRKPSSRIPPYIHFGEIGDCERRWLYTLPEGTVIHGTIRIKPSSRSVGRPKGAVCLEGTYISFPSRARAGMVKRFSVRSLLSGSPFSVG